MSDDMTITPKQQWEKLKREIKQRIDEIDKETPFSDTEPEWWLEMQTLRRSIQNKTKKEQS